MTSTATRRTYNNRPPSDAETEDTEEDFELEADDDVDQEAAVRDRKLRTEKVSSQSLSSLSHTQQLKKCQEALTKEIKQKEAAETMLNLFNSNMQQDPAAMREIQLQLELYNAKIKLIQRDIESLKTPPPGKPGTSSSRQSRRQADSASLSLRKSTSFNTAPDSWRNRLSHFRADTVSGTSSQKKRPGINIMKGVTSNITEALAAIKLRPEAAQARLDDINNLIKILKSSGKIGSLPCLDDIMKTAVVSLNDPVLEIRASGYRIIRYLVSDRKSAQKAWNYHLEVFILRTLIRDVKNEMEREQALRLIRAFIDCPQGIAFLPFSMVSILVSMSEHAEDKLRNIALQTLSELALRDIDSVATCSGLKVIFSSLFDGPQLVVDFLIPTVAALLDRPETRRYFKPAVDVEMVMSNFTDGYNRGTPNNDAKLESAGKAIAGLMATWPGLLYFCMDDKRAFRCLVDSLRLPFEDIQRVLLNMLFEIFRVEIPKWLPDIVSNRGMSCLFTFLYSTHILVHYKVPTTESESKETVKPESSRDLNAHNERANLLDHQLSILLTIFIDCGLLEALTDLATGENKSIATRVFLFIGEIIELANRVLPPSGCVRIQTLSTLFGMASAFKDESSRHQATSALVQIERVQSNKKSFLNQLEDRVTHKYQTNVNPYHSINTVDDIKFRMGLQIDDNHFRMLLMDCQVLIFKDYMKWNWDYIVELLDGPLMNPKRSEEVLRNTKFFKRLLAFYSPRKLRFSNIKVSKASMRYTHTGCILIKTLLSSADGAKFLGENRLLPEIASCLSELDPINGLPPDEPMFSKDRMEKTLTSEYFTLIGTLCKYNEGLEALEKARMFNVFYHLSELRSRDDLIKTIVMCMDYSIHGHPHIILSKIMTSGYKHVRMFATNYVRYIMRSEVMGFSQWGISLLINQLYDPSLEVCERAVAVLDEACRDPANLEMLVSLRPSLDHLGEIASPLLFRFLATPLGFAYLCEIEYTEKEMSFWNAEGNVKYAIQQELALAKSMQSKDKSPKALEVAAIDDAQKWIDTKSVENVGYVTPHFFGELARTDLGYKMLADSGHFKTFHDAVKNGFTATNDLNDTVKFKGAIWAVGHIGSSVNGLKLLEPMQTVEALVKLAETSSVLSVKGTSFYALGLISRTPEGAAILEDLGWESAISSRGAEGLAIPTRPHLFLSVPLWETRSPHYNRIESSIFEHEDPDASEMLKNIGNMSNSLSANAAAKVLTKLKTDRPDLVSSPDLYARVLRITSVYHYKMTARRYLQELFDKVEVNEKTAHLFSPVDAKILKQSIVGLNSRNALNESKAAEPKNSVSSVKSTATSDSAQPLTDKQKADENKSKRSMAAVKREGFSAETTVLSPFLPTVSSGPACAV